MHSRAPACGDRVTHQPALPHPHGTGDDHTRTRLLIARLIRSSSVVRPISGHASDSSTAFSLVATACAAYEERPEVLTEVFSLASEAQGRGQFMPRANLELGISVRQVHFHCSQGHEQRLRDLLVAYPGSRQLGDASFAARSAQSAPTPARLRGRPPAARSSSSARSASGVAPHRCASSIPSRRSGGRPLHPRCAEGPCRGRRTLRRATAGPAMWPECPRPGATAASRRSPPREVRRPAERRRADVATARPWPPASPGRRPHGRPARRPLPAVPESAPRRRHTSRATCRGCAPSTPAPARNPHGHARGRPRPRAAGHGRAAAKRRTASATNSPSMPRSTISASPSSVRPWSASESKTTTRPGVLR